MGNVADNLADMVFWNDARESCFVGYNINKNQAFPIVKYSHTITTVTSIIGINKNIDNDPAFEEEYDKELDAVIFKANGVEAVVLQDYSDQQDYDPNKSEWNPDKLEGVGKEIQNYFFKHNDKIFNKYIKGQLSKIGFKKPKKSNKHIRIEPREFYSSEYLSYEDEKGNIFTWAMTDTQYCRYSVNNSKAHLFQIDKSKVVLKKLNLSENIGPYKMKYGETT